MKKSRRILLEVVNNKELGIGFPPSYGEEEEYYMKLGNYLSKNQEFLDACKEDGRDPKVYLGKYWKE